VRYGEAAPLPPVSTIFRMVKILSTDARHATALCFDASGSHLFVARWSGEGQRLSNLHAA
jgi:hypothetical protein